MRLSTLLRQYNLSADTMIKFLARKGYTHSLSLTSKIEEPYLTYIHEVFASDRKAKEESKTLVLSKSADDLLVDELKKIPKNFSKRISIEKGSSSTYKDIFGACFFGAKSIICIDPYLRQDHQIENLNHLFQMIADFSSNKIKFQLLTCYNPKDTIPIEEIDSKLKKLKNKFDESHRFDFIYTIERKELLHDRQIYIDDRYIIDLTRGLDIFESYINSNIKINKACTIFITRQK